MPSPSYLFYDLETSGLNKCFDQVMQFAAIRTDLSLREIERYNFTVTLNPDVLPSPYASTTHRISLATLQNSDNEYVAMKKIHRIINTPGTISLGYNTLGFDDEFLRFSFYRNLLTPYTHQYANQCSRMDIYPIVLWYYINGASCIDWPEVDGRPSFKLENIGQLNQLMHGQAHDAMVDVEATVELTRRLQQDSTRWQTACRYFNKQHDSKIISTLPRVAIGQRTTQHATLMHGALGAARCYQAPVIALGQHKVYKNQSLWLRLDLADLQQATPDDFQSHVFMVQRKPAEQKWLLSPDHPQTHHFTSEQQDTFNENLAWLNNNTTTLNAMVTHYQNATYPFIENIDPDAALYQNGFPSAHDTRTMQQFHQASAENKYAVATELQDASLQSLALRLLAKHFKQHLPQDEKALSSHYFLNNENPNSMVDFKNQPRRSKSCVQAEIVKIQQEKTLDKDQKALVDELQQLIKKPCAQA